MKNLFYKSIVVVLLMGFVSSAQAQGWIKSYELDPFWGITGEAIAKADDGGFVILDMKRWLSSTYQYHPGIIRTDANGDTLWTKRYWDTDYGRFGDIIKDEVNGGFVIFGTSHIDTSGANQEKIFNLLKVNTQGEIEWETEIYNPANNSSVTALEVWQASDGSFYCYGMNDYNPGGYRILMKFAANGTHLWSSTPWTKLNRLNGMAMLPSGNIVIAGSDDGYIYLSIHNPSTGEQIDEQYLGSDMSLMDMILDSEGNMRVWVFNNAVGAAQLKTVNEAGDEIGNITLPNFLDYSDQVLQDGNGDFIFRNFDSGTNHPTFRLRKYSEALGQWLWDYTYTDITFNGERAQEMILGDDGNYYVGGYLLGTTSARPFLTKVTSEGIVYSNELVGRVAFDENDDCVLEPSDQNLGNWLIEAQGSYADFYTLTDEEGNYTLLLDTGTYVVNALTPSPAWATCGPDVADFTSFNQVEALDLPAQADTICPMLNISMGITNLRRCFERTYTFDYCNIGTIDADDVSVVVEIDSLLEIVSATIPIASQDGNTLTFDIGTVPLNACGHFEVTIFIPCEVELGWTHCSSATIYPINSCETDDPGWTGASIEVRGECENNELVRFEIENVGTAPMAGALDFVIIEDEMILLTGDFDLNPNEIEPIDLPATGSTYIINAEQEPLHPGMSMPTVFVQGCGTGSNNETAPPVVTWLPIDDNFFHTDIDCRRNVDSYDPNEKIASPIGWGDEHYLEANVDIEYQINFQNEGTDTAFRVVVIDTLPQELDFTSFREMTSSFPYELSISQTETGSTVLRFNFNDINLLPKSWDEPASQGFLKYKIAQQTDLEIGTVIQNRAGIYFDFNEPIITNYAWHTIGEDFIDIVNDVKEGNLTLAMMSIAPNPVYNTALVSIPSPQAEGATLKLFNVDGKLLQTQLVHQSQATIDAAELKSGIYFLQVIKEGKMISSGRIVVR